jgi:hypothetical protein
MSHNTFDQFKALVTRLASADGTLAEEQSQEILSTELAHEVLDAIAAGRINPYSINGPYGEDYARRTYSHPNDWSHMNP